jgi:uncharacterized protein YodC (DUF2158 family)
VFRIGDVVRLKSGGPKMTIEGLEAETDKGQIVIATWFHRQSGEDYNDDRGWIGVHSVRFEARALDPVED